MEEEVGRDVCGDPDNRVGKQDDAPAPREVFFLLPCQRVTEAKEVPGTKADAVKEKRIRKRAAGERENEKKKKDRSRDDEEDGDVRWNTDKGGAGEKQQSGTNAGGESGCCDREDEEMIKREEIKRDEGTCG